MSEEIICPECGKKQNNYFGFCSYTCWKLYIDKCNPEDYPPELELYKKVNAKDKKVKAEYYQKNKKKIAKKRKQKRGER